MLAPLAVDISVCDAVIVDIPRAYPNFASGYSGFSVRSGYCVELQRSRSKVGIVCKVRCTYPYKPYYKDRNELAECQFTAQQLCTKGIDCGMTAVLGLDRTALSACCEEASALGCVQICNYNCPGQLVIGGEKSAVDKAAELAKAAGARRCLPLKVSGPFHTRLMAPAGDALAERFKTERFREMQIPVLFNCLGREKADADTIPDLLVKQVQSSVYMEDTLRRLGELGVDHILEVGPGSALSGFVKKTLPGVPCASVETPEQLDAALAAWRDEA